VRDERAANSAPGSVSDGRRARRPVCPDTWDIVRRNLGIRIATTGIALGTGLTAFELTNLITGWDPGHYILGDDPPEEVPPPTPGATGHAANGPTPAPANRSRRWSEMSLGTTVSDAAWRYP